MSGELLIDGTAVGPALVIEPLSFWGGFDPETGVIIDRSHPALGVSLTGVLVAMPHGRGSSSSATVVAEALRLGTGPAGFLLQEADEIIATGVFVANSLYDLSVPVGVGQETVVTGRRYRLDTRGLAAV